MLKILIVILLTVVSGIFYVAQRKESGKNSWEHEESNVQKEEAHQMEKLELSTINTKNQGVYFYDTEWITNYSQVEGNHYYWLRYDANNGKYIIYRDNKKKVGMFEMPYSVDDVPCWLDGFVKYGSNFYAIISYLDMEREVENNEVQELVRVDLEKEKLEVLCDVSNAHITGDGEILFCCIYKNYFYFDKRTVWQSYDGRPGISVRVPLQGGIMEELSSTTNMRKAYPYLLYIDNKVFYGVKENSKISLFSYNMQSNKEQQFFQLEEKENADEKDGLLMMDEEYIYYKNYMISRKNEKIFYVFPKMKKSEDGRKYCTSNDKYVFYLDNKNRVHRLEKKTKQDIIIRKEKTLAISCTEKKLYVRVRDEKGYAECSSEYATSDEYSDDGRDYYADDLYCVNFDGTEEKKIWNGGYDE